jgi:hypothetical protein
MNALDTLNNQPTSSHRPWVGGLILIAIGVLALAGQFIQAVWYGEFLMGALALVFILSGLITRKNGFLIPGGILAGLSLGIAAQHLLSDTTSLYRSGIFLVSFAAGWVLISLLSLINRQWMPWPLIPGTIMAVLGGAILTNLTTLPILKLLGTYGWPLILIAVGAYILLRRK